jgi:predicted homoserine dehydrogenase-like protein
VTLAKRDLRAGEIIDGIGGFTVYGLIDNAAAARAENALPMGLAEGCVLRRSVSRDSVIGSADVELPPTRLSDQLWAEQQRRWPALTSARTPSAFEPAKRAAGSLEPGGVAI